MKKENAKGVENIRRVTKEFNDKHREVKRSFRSDRRRWVENFASKAQEAERESNMKEL